MGLNSVQYETIYYKYINMFFSVTYYEKMFRIFCTEKKARHPLEKNTPDGRKPGFCGDFTASGWGELAAKDAVESVQRNRGSTFQELHRNSGVLVFLKGGLGEEMGQN